MKLIDNEYLTLWYHFETKIVHHQFHQPAQGQPFRDILTRGAEVFEKYGAHKWLSDDRKQGALHPDDSIWAMNEWSARVMKAGWKYWAVVTPQGTLGKLNIKRFINLYADRGVQVQLYSDPGAAMSWLENPEFPMTLAR